MACFDAAFPFLIMSELGRVVDPICLVKKTIKNAVTRMVRARSCPRGKEVGIARLSACVVLFFLK